MNLTGNIAEIHRGLDKVHLMLAEINTVGQKGWKKRTRYSDEKATLMFTYTQLAGALKGKLEIQMIRKAVADYGKLKREFREKLFGHMKDYDAGKITITQLAARLKGVIGPSWEEAYVLGTRAVGNSFGLTPEDRTFLKGARKTEYMFLDKFMGDIAANREKMGRYDRLEMYVNSMDAMYQHGQVDGSPDNVEIDWVLHPAEHCPDCVKFAAEGPYTKKTLPAIPRDGTTQCLSGCKCTLRIRRVEPKVEPPKVAGPKRWRVPAGYRLPKPEEMEIISGYDNEIRNYRALIKVTKDPKLKRQYIQFRRDANAKLIDYLEKNKIYWTPGIELNIKLATTVEAIKEEAIDLLMEGT